MNFYRSVDKNLRDVEHVLLHQQVIHRLSSNRAYFFALADILRFVDDFSESIDENLQCEPSITFSLETSLLTERGSMTIFLL